MVKIFGLYIYTKKELARRDIKIRANVRKATNRQIAMLLHKKFR